MPASAKGIDRIDPQEQRLESSKRSGTHTHTHTYRLCELRTSSGPRRRTHTTRHRSGAGFITFLSRAPQRLTRAKQQRHGTPRTGRIASQRKTCGVGVWLLRVQRRVRGGRGPRDGGGGDRPSSLETAREREKESTLPCFY